MACSRPTSSRQSALVSTAIDNHHRGDKSRTSTSTDRGDSRAHVYYYYCHCTQTYIIPYSVPLQVYCEKWEYTPAVRSKILSKLIFVNCVWYFDRAYYGLCVLIKDIGRRLPLQLQCSYQGQQGDVSQSVRGNYIKPVSEGDKIWQLRREMYPFIKWFL